MKLIKLENWAIVASEETWGLQPFAAILKRDKTKNKEIAHKELLYIYYFCSIKSDYLSIPEDKRGEEIKKDVGLPDKWTQDEVITNAINFYNSFDSPLETLYRQTLTAVQAIGKYLENTEALLAERDVAGKPVYDISKITTSVQRVPKLMADIKAAYKEVIKEQEDNENKTKGSKKFNTYEDLDGF